MFPNLSQRLLIVLAVSSGGVLIWSIRGLVSSPDGSSGISLMSAQTGVIGAWLLVIAASAPAWLLAMAVSIWGHRLAGVFTLGATLAVLAVAGGSSEGWFLMARNTPAALPGWYGQLMIETTLWYAPVALLCLAIAQYREPLRSKWPRLIISPTAELELNHSWRDPNSWYAALSCTIVSATAGYFLLQSTDTAQLVVGLFVAFTLGGLAGHLLFTHTSHAATLLSPLVVALAVYAYVWLRFDSADQLLAAWWDESHSTTQALPGLAVALPINYVSSGIAGTALGIGWAQSVLQGNEPAVSRPVHSHG